MNFLNSKYFYIVLFAMILAFLYIPFHFYKENELRGFLKLQTKEANHRYESITFFPEDVSNFIFTYLINTPKVINIFKYADQSNEFEKAIVRKRLYKELSKIYEELQEYNIQQLHFHLANNDSFLRFHRPLKFGDNLSNIRSTVVYANKHKVSVQGFEEGRIFHGYRFVYPLFDKDNKHLGSVEVSHSIVSFKHTYERAFKNISLDIVIDKKVVKEKVFDSEMSNFISSSINENFLHTKTMMMNKKVKHAIKSIKGRKEIAQKMKNFENFSISINHKKHKGIVSFIAISNPITKKKVGYAISFQQSDYLGYFYEERSAQMMYLFLVGFLLTLIIYYVRRFNKELSRKVYKDSMMNIYNRRFFESYLSESCKKQRRNNSALSLVMFDVDHFKNVNDTYGHDVGDAALKLLANVVEEHIRAVDVFARWGGEEFMLLLEDTDVLGAQRVSENLRLAIQKYSKVNEKIPEFTCSFGIINLEGIKSVDQAFKEVDKKLYIAKDTGRNKVVV